MVSSSESFIPKHLAIWMLVILSIPCCSDVMPIRFDPLNRCEGLQSPDRELYSLQSLLECLATRFVPTNGVQCLQHFLFWWRQIKFFTKRRLRNIISILHSWCALNSLAVMNTMFEKKNIHKYIWQHPGSKQWHCIDYIIMRQRQI